MHVPLKLCVGSTAGGCIVVGGGGGGARAGRGGGAVHQLEDKQTIMYPHSHIYEQFINIVCHVGVRHVVLRGGAHLCCSQGWREPVRLRTVMRYPTSRPIGQPGKAQIVCVFVELKTLHPQISSSVLRRFARLHNPRDAIGLRAQQVTNHPLVQSKYNLR